MVRHRQRRDLRRDRPRRRRHHDDPRRRRRHHAAQPCAAGDRRAVRHAGSALSRPHRPRPRPRARHRPAHAARAAPRSRRAPTISRRTCWSCRPCSGPLQPGQTRPGRARRGHQRAAVDPRLQPVRRAARRHARPALRLRLAFRARRADAGARRSTASGFKPSAQLDRPYAMVGVNVDRRRHRRRGAAPVHLARSSSFTNMVRGTRGKLQPPIDDIETYWSPPEKAQASQHAAPAPSSARRETVRRGPGGLHRDDRRRRADGRVRHLRPRARGCAPTRSLAEIGAALRMRATSPAASSR